MIRGRKLDVLDMMEEVGAKISCRYRYIIDIEPVCYCIVSYARTLTEVNRLEIIVSLLPLRFISLSLPLSSIR